MGVMSNVSGSSTRSLLGVRTAEMSLDSTRLTANLHPKHEQERLMSAGHVVSKGVGRGTIVILAQLLLCHS